MQIMEILMQIVEIFNVDYGDINGDLEIYNVYYGDINVDCRNI